MRLKLIRLWRDFRFPLLLAFGTLPGPLVLLSYYAPSLLPLVWIWPLCYLLLDALSTRVKGKWRLLYAVLEVGILGLTAWYALNTVADKIVLMGPGMYCLLLLWGLVLSSEDRNDQIGPLWYVVSIAMHLLSQLLVFSTHITETFMLLSVEPWLLLSFFAFAILALITLNQSNRRSSTGGRQSASRLMQRKNLLLVLGFFAIAVLISFVPAIIDLVSELFKWIVIGILWLIHILSKEDSQAQGAAGTPMGTEDSLFLGGVTKAMPQWLSIILTVIVVVLLAAFAVYAVYIIAKKLSIFVKYLMRISGKYIHAVTEDYVDEITDTRVGLEDQKTQRGKRNRLSATEEKRLPPDQRIRYRYKRLMQKHPEWFSGSTARENLPPEAAPIYEKVRYSPYPVTEEDAQSFAEQTKKI